MKEEVCQIVITETERKIQYEHYMYKLYKNKPNGLTHNMI